MGTVRTPLIVNRALSIFNWRFTAGVTASRDEIVTVPLLKKLTLRVSGGYISSQCCLRSTQWPPGRSMGAVNSGNALDLNSRTSACGPSARGRRDAAFGGTTRGDPGGAWGTAANPAQPMALRSPGPLGHPLRPSPSLLTCVAVKSSTITNA